jgi:hypothetical protein
MRVFSRLKPRDFNAAKKFQFPNASEYPSCGFSQNSAEARIKYSPPFKRHPLK